MTPLLTKLRKITGWTLIIISTILMFISIFIATTGELLKGGGIYVASQLTWYPGPVSYTHLTLPTILRV